MSRLLLTLPFLLFVPGYLLIQALVVRGRTMRRRWIHAVAAVGVTPAVVGLLVLSTSLVPGGMRPVPIVMTTTAACLLLAFVTLLRRARDGHVATA